jgi:hypothetical protein
MNRTLRAGRFVGVKGTAQETLGTDQGTHLLVGSLVDVLAHDREAFTQGRTGNTELHGLGVVTVLTPDGMLHLGFEIVEVGGVEFRAPHLVHQPRDVRALAGHTGSGHETGLDPLRFFYIGHGVVSAPAPAGSPC